MSEETGVGRGVGSEIFEVSRRGGKTSMSGVGLLEACPSSAGDSVASQERCCRGRSVIERGGDPVEGIDGTGLFSGLASRWHEFVGPRKRCESLTPFLAEQVPRVDQPLVLDLAAGIGCDAVELARMGLQVVANEISEEFRLIAQRAASRQCSTLSFTSVDWRALSRHFPERSFDLVYLVGNSLCLLLDEAARREAAREIAVLLRPGGRLVVDERNFPYIIEGRRAILGGEFRYRGDVLYCGQRIQARPVSISHSGVVFSYTDVVKQSTVGTLEMHPFAAGELRMLFEREGLSLAGEWSDLSLGRKEDADFFTYAFERRERWGRDSMLQVAGRSGA